MNEFHLISFKVKITIRVMMKLDGGAQKDVREVHICLPKMVTGSRQHNEPGRCYYL